MKKYIISIFVLVIFLLVPSTNALTVSSYDDDAYPISTEIDVIDNSTQYDTFVLYNQISQEKLYYRNQTDLYFSDFETKVYVTKTICAGIGNFEQNITISYPSGYEFTLDNAVSAFATYLTHYVITANYITILSGRNYTDYPINETGQYTVTVQTDFTNSTGNVERYFSYYTFTVTSQPLDGSYVIPTFTYDASFIGTLSGFICMFALFATPMLIAYKIKHTGKKLKWIFYGFITVCIIFFCMISCFQMG